MPFRGTKQNINGFDKNPQNINRNGRPPKLLTSIINELKKAGYERVSVSNVIESYELLFGLDEERIKEIIADKNKPMFLRIVGKAMLSPKGFEMLEKMQDRAYGRSVQPNINLDFELSDKEKQILDKFFKQ